MILKVDYDLVAPGQKYAKIEEYIKQYDWAHPLKSTWLISTGRTVEQTLDDLLRIVDNNDKVLVTDVTRSIMYWYGLPQDVSDWIMQHIKPGNSLYR